MSPGGRVAILVCLLAAGSLGAAAQEYAEQSGQGPAPKRPRKFTVQDLSGEVFISADMRRDNEKVGSSPTTHETDNFYEEGITLRAHGHGLRPSILEWSGQVSLGMKHERRYATHRDNEDNAELIAYELKALFLKQKPVSLRAFASQSRDLLNQEFANALEVESSEQGVEVYTHGRVPVSLLLRNLDVTQEEDVRTDDAQSRFLRLSVSDRRDGNWLTIFAYDFQNTDRTITDHPPGGPERLWDRPVETDTFSLINHYRFGQGASEHYLHGNLRAYHRGGFYVNDIYTFQQELETKHSESLESFLKGYANLDETETLRDEILTGEAGFTKAFGENLSLSGKTFATKYDFTGGQEDTLGGSVDAEYRCPTPIGRYVAALGVGMEGEGQKATGGRRLVRDERIVLSGLTFSQLRKPNVLPWSISVTNASRTITYENGVDYIVRTTGAITEIARRISGSIRHGEEVLVSYSARAAGEAKIATALVRCENRLELKKLPLAPYVRYYLRDDDLVSGEDPGSLERESSTVTGIRLEYNGLSVSAEHEIKDRLLVPPSNASRLLVNFARSIGKRIEVSVGGRAERLRYEDAEEFGLEPDRDYLNSVGGLANITARITKKFLIRLEGNHYATEGRENDRLTRLGAAVEWSFDDLSILLEAHHSIFQQELSSGNTNVLSFNIRRKF